MPISGLFRTHLHVLHPFLVFGLLALATFFEEGSGRGAMFDVGMLSFNGK